MGKPKTNRKVKLTNKSSSKKMKSSTKRLALVKSKTQNKKIFTLPAHKRKKDDGKSQSVKLDYSRAQVPSDNDLDTDDAEFSDEEMKQFVSKNVKNMSFLGPNRTKTKNGVALFEQVPRASSNLYDDKQSNSKTVELLPIKGERGVIKRTQERELKEADLEEEEIEEQLVEVKPMTVIEVIAAQQEEMNQKKLQIAQLSLDIVENPQEHISKLKQLLLLCSPDEPNAIKKLAVLSLLEIFKDIVPSYRIRELTIEERSVKVSRDVRKVREYEDTLLRSYQKYLQILDENIKDCVAFLKRRQKQRKVRSYSVEKSTKAFVTLSITSVKCLAELLNTIPHFNFRNNIITVLVPNIELSRELLQAGDISYEAIKSVLKADFTGDIALEVIKVVHGMSKSKHNLKPKVIEVLYYLQLDAHLINGTQQQGNKSERLNKKWEAIKKMSKKEKKRKKVEDKLNKELQEAEASENQSRVGKKQTEILKFLFVIYFRVLKSDHKTPLLPVVLKGLARYSHLINVDFFGDLMNCLETLLRSGELNTEERLHCVLTALKVLSGQGEVLTIDPRQFYSELYNVFLNVTPATSTNCFDSIKECLNIMLVKRRKQVSSPQVFGFLKRLSTVLLQQHGDRLPHIFLLIRSIFQLYEKCDYLLDNENFGRGVFLPQITNPEHCNAESTALWEFSLLAKFYEPSAEMYCKHILDGAPSSGTRALPVKFIQRATRNDDDTITSSNDDAIPDFEHISSTAPPAKKKRISTGVEDTTAKREFMALLSASEHYSENITNTFVHNQHS